MITRIKTLRVEVAEPPHSLMIKAACAYFGMSRIALLKPSGGTVIPIKRRILFLLLNRELQMSNHDIAVVTGHTRQGVDYHVEKASFEVDFYLQFTCDYKNILKLFTDLKNKQEIWLTQLLQ